MNGLPDPLPLLVTDLRVHPNVLRYLRRPFENDDSVADVECLVNGVRDEHRSLVVLPHQMRELCPQTLRGDFIQRREWLVAQQQTRLVGEFSNLVPTDPPWRLYRVEGT